MNAEQRYRQQAGSRRKSEEAERLWSSRKAEIELMYNVTGLSQADIAAHYEVSQGCVANVLRRLGIPIKSHGRSGTANGRYKDGSQSREYRKVVIKEKCNRCPSTENLCIHHKDDDHYNNDPANLEVLCKSCHLSHHKTQYWKAKREGRKPPKSNGINGWLRT